MPTIDERVVAMSFENTVFEARVATTMATLGKLDIAIKNIGNANGLQNIETQANKVTLQGPMSALDKLRAKLGMSGQGAAQGFGDIERAGSKVTLEGPSTALDKLKSKFGQLNAGTTFTDIEKASDRVELSGLSRALDSVTGKFSVLEGAASVALGGIAANAAMKGAAFGKSFAFGPITQGFDEYKTNLNSIQTILANTEGQQVSGLKAVNDHLGELNTYSDQTIYNFSEMAKNIGTFTAAGVDLDKSTQSIKGIANLAALSGSNSQQASTAMYQLSQAIAAGKVGLQDWNSVVNAGMGGAVFQKSLIRTAENMGSIKKGAVEIDKATGKATINGESFRESISSKPGQKSWLTDEVLVKTLGQFTGDMKEADLVAQGFSKNQAKAILQQAKTAKAAATEVKTLSQVFDVAKETIGSGWSKTFQLVFGNFNQAKKTFTDLSNTVNGFINASSNMRNKVLGDWSKLGGRAQLIDGIKIAFYNLMDVLGTVKDAFRDVFPPATGVALFELTSKFAELMITLTPSPQLLDNIRHIFAGLFAALHIGWSIIKGVAGVFFDLLGIVGKGSGGILSFAGSIGDFVVALDKAITSGGLLEGLFKGLSSVLAIPLRLLRAIGEAIANLFTGGDETKRTDQMNELLRFGKVLSPIERVIMRVKDAWDKLAGAFSRFKDMIQPWLSVMAEKLSGVGDILANAFDGLDYEKVLQGLQVGFVGGIFVMLKKAFGGKSGGILGTLQETLGGVNKLLGAFTGQMEAMQSKIKAEALLAIAGAVGVLAGGIFVLSTINGEDLSRAMTGVAVGLGELMGAMKLMTSGMGLLGVLQLPIIAAGMIGLAVAVTILSGAMKVFATMSWEGIAKGLVGIAGALTSIAAGMTLMPPTLPLTAAGLILIGIALNVIAAAIAQFSRMSMADIGKGLFAVAEALGLIALTMNMMPPNMIASAAGLFILSLALVSIGGAIRSIGELDVATILKGLGGIAAALAGIGLAMSLMPPNLPITAAGLILVAIALQGVARAVGTIGEMSVGGIIKGIIGLGAALNVIAEGLYLMSGTLAGSAALVAAAVALAILAPTLAFLGTLKWGTIFKGLAAVALSLGTLAVVGALAAAPLSALGVALLPLAAGFVLVAGAVYIFAKGIALLGDQGAKGIGVFLTALTAFVAMVPTIVITFVKGLIGIVDQLTVLLPKVVVALGVIIDTIIAFVIAKAPSLALAIGVLVDSILQVLVENMPKIIAAGVQLLGNLLNGISQNIGQVTNKVSDIIVKFLAALAANAPRLAKAGADTLVRFINGITNNLGRIVVAVGQMITKFITAVGNQLPKIVTAGANLIVKFLNAIAAAVPRFIRAGTNIILGFLDGVQDAIPRLARKALSVARTFMNTMADSLVGLVDIGFKAIIRFLHGIANSIRTNRKDLFEAGLDIAKAIVEGIVEGLGWVAQKVIRPIINSLFEWLPDKIKKILGIKSPSRVFAEIGKQTMMGFVVGVQETQPAMGQAMDDAAATVINAATSSFGDMPNLLEGVMDVDPTITPILDLSRVEKDAQKLSDLTNVTPITAAASYDQASTTSQEVSAAQKAVDDGAETGGVSFSFEQNNNSPKALDDVEIYRQTRNQLSQVKQALGLVS